MDIRKIGLALAVVALIGLIVALNWGKQNEPQKVETKTRTPVYATLDDEEVVLEGVSKIEKEIPSSIELENGGTVEVPEGTTATTHAELKLRYRFKKEEPERTPLPEPAPVSEPSARPERDELRTAIPSRTENKVLVYHNHQNKVIVVQQGGGPPQHAPQPRRVRYQGRTAGEALDQYFDGAWSNGCQPRRSHSRHSRGGSWGRSSWGRSRGPGEALDDFFDDGGW